MENAETLTPVRDWRGRTYLVGPVPADRRRLFWLAWAAMAAIGPLQYGYAALLTRDRPGLATLAAWILCQAVTALPALHLVRRGRLGVRTALAAGAVLSALGLATLAVATSTPGSFTFGTPGSFTSGTPAIVTADAGLPASSLAAASLEPGSLLLTLLGYAVLGGLGAGLVYAVCTEVIAAWHPERPATRVGLVTGAFGYGALPVVVWAGLDPATLPLAFATAAVIAALAVGAAARALRLPPPRWWPDTVDPRRHALDPSILRRTPSAVRQFSLAAALRTPALAVLAGILVCAGAVSIFDVVAVAATGAWGPLALLIALNGAGRALAMRWSEAWGRKRVLAAVLALLALGQPLLAAGLSAPPLLWAGAVAAGLGGGSFYPLVASLVRDFFGVEQVGRIHAVVYSAKAAAGIAAAALAALSLAAPAPALLAAALVAVLPAVASTRLRAPGRPATIPV
ncbi:hypothetical protein [Thermoactinospora rubra]|uniref:hypothetical protein n=1 Tax=Thermoactinospora rubra TaxID=1088767 RepID=UPI000A102F7C|nr:hypothetical protein [Thermoactinospora rubra]